MAVTLATNLGVESNALTVKLAAGAVCLILALPISLVLSDQDQQWVVDTGKGSLIMALIAEIAMIADDRGTLALAVAFFSLGATIWLFADDRGERVTGAMVACASGVFGAIEIVFLEDNLAGGDAYRMNTVFKFYNQVWLLLAISGAVVLGKAISRAGFPPFSGGESTLGLVSRPPAIEREEPAAQVSPGLSQETANFDDATGAIPADAIDAKVEDDDIAESSGISDHELLRQRWARTTVLVGAVVILMSLFYPVLATRPRLAERFDGHPGPGTLNAYDWMRYGTITNDQGDVIGFSGDREAIYWFIDHVSGSPVIMEAAIGAYRGNGSRFAINTGLPAVIGWGGHESQQRYSEGIGERESDVREFYSTTDVARKREILDKYGVAYVIVGDVERYTLFDHQYWADPAGVTAIAQMVGGRSGSGVPERQHDGLPGIEAALTGGRAHICKLLRKQMVTD